MMLNSFRAQPAAHDSPLLAVIGWPAKHSLSPAFQQPALDHVGVAARYVIREIPPEGLAAFAAEARGPNWLGFNVTIPHKLAIMPLLDEIVPAARAIGAVNTVVNRGGRLIGHNTDVTGFGGALRLEAGFDPAGKRVALLGAGGAARGVLKGLVDAGAAHVTIANRTLERAQHLARELGQGRAHAVALDGDELRHVLPTCHLLVNATSVGMHAPAAPADPAALPPHAVVYDVIYTPAETELLRLARARGLPAYNGLSMLVYQGGDAFELFTGRPAPRDLMLRAALAALSRS